MIDLPRFIMATPQKTCGVAMPPDESTEEEDPIAALEALADLQKDKEE